MNILTDIANADIPLLLSKSSMKKCNMQLNFENDTLNVFGNNVPLSTTTSGLYALPITKPKQFIENIENIIHKNHEKITLKVTTEKSDKEIAVKLHRQFAHPSAKKLLALIDNSDEKWANNENLKEEIRRVTENCQICKIYKKPPPRPIVSLPMATQFQETVAMDLKYSKDRLLIHLIDLATRLSASAVIPNNNKDTIIKKLFQIWISVYGRPQKFLIDNGGEFANAEFLELAEQFGIHIKTTAAESAWSNGVVERHNLILGEMLDKVMTEKPINIDIAIAWCINAKNSKENLEALYQARKAFVESENSNRLRRALAHNVRTTGDIKYLTGDKVYYKRASNREWHGLASVLGQDGQQVLVKHGSFYIRVHPCRLQLCQKENEKLTNTNENVNNQSANEKECKPNDGTELDNDDSDDDKYDNIEEVIENNNSNQLSETTQESSENNTNQIQNNNTTYQHLY